MRSSIFAAGLAGLFGALSCDSPGGVGPQGQPAASAAPAPSSAPSASSSSGGATASRAAAPSVSAARLPVPDAIVLQHVLVAYSGAKRVPRNVVRTKLEAKSRAAEALAKVRAGAEFEDIVAAYSDDTGSVNRRGLLGKVRRTGLDPAFARAAFALDVEEVSDVVETPFGFHIIKRTQ